MGALSIARFAYGDGDYAESGDGGYGGEPIETPTTGHGITHGYSSVDGNDGEGCGKGNNDAEGWGWGSDDTLVLACNDTSDLRAVLINAVTRAVRCG